MESTMFCYPYAGGSKQIYSNLVEELKNIMNLIPMEYSGHGCRFNNGLLYNYKDVIEDAVRSIYEKKLEEYCLFGHSLGGLIAYGIAVALEKGSKSKTLFISGINPPHLLEDKYKGMSKLEIFECIYNLGKIPSMIKEDEEFYEIFSEIIYADILVLESFSKNLRGTKIDNPIVVFYGAEDEETSEEKMMEWASYTSSNCTVIKVEGGHFFPFDNYNKFKIHFKRELMKILKSRK